MRLKRRAVFWEHNPDNPLQLLAHCLVFEREGHKRLPKIAVSDGLCQVDQHGEIGNLVHDLDSVINHLINNGQVDLPRDGFLKRHTCHGNSLEEEAGETSMQAFWTFLDV